jgi:hypothetical protein
VKGDFLQMSVSDHILPGCLKKRGNRELSFVNLKFVEERTYFK